jgi:hypothetical protein
MGKGYQSSSHIHKEGSNINIDTSHLSIPNPVSEKKNRSPSMGSKNFPGSVKSNFQPGKMDTGPGQHHHHKRNSENNATVNINSNSNANSHSKPLDKKDLSKQEPVKIIPLAQVEEVVTRTYQDRLKAVLTLHPAINPNSDVPTVGKGSHIIATYRRENFADLVKQLDKEYEFLIKN